ncbi:MAG: hypothetical protein ABI091_16655 [Ferruginibacter sp.]
MKKVSVAFSSLVALILLGSSCSKKNDSKPVCKIVTITDVSPSSTTTYNLSYNNDGKLSTLQSTSGSTTTSKVFTYNNDVILITTTSGSDTQTDSVVVNGDGLIQSNLHRDGSNKTVTTYTYSGTQLQKYVSQYNDEAPTTTTTTFANGDLTAISDGETFSYNTDKAASVGDYLSLAQLIQYGATFIKTTHQIKSFAFGSSIENFNYTYDSHGNISGITATGGSDIETITYQYNCNN